MRKIFFAGIVLCVAQTVVAATDDSLGLGPALVGAAADSDCGFNSIQAAINAGHDEIRVANNTAYDENILIQNQSLDIKGGYVNCFAADSDIRTDTITTSITSTVADAIITIDNDGGNYLINLSQLYINNGIQGMFSEAAGVVVSGADTQLNMERSRISEHDGRGLTAIGVASIHLSDIYLGDNTVIGGNGGGIMCDSSNIVVSGASVIRNNNAVVNTRGAGSSGQGGGVYATQSCSFTFYSGPPHINSGSGGILNNSANQGGAIFATLGSTIELLGTEVDVNGQVLGDAEFPVNLWLNTADEDGGAIYLIGGGTLLTGSGIDVRQNEVGNNGGAIYSGTGATTVITRMPGACWDNNKCNYFLRNASGLTDKAGGAIFVFDGTLAVGNAWFEENKADISSAIHLLDAVSTIEGSVFYNNRPITNFDANETIQAAFFSDLTVAFSTFVDNDPNVGTMNITSGSNLTLVGTIVYDLFNLALVTNSADTITNYCLYVNDSTNITGSQIIESSNDPFVDLANQDFHLADTSLTDVCDTSVYTPSLNDFDNQPRGFDAPISNLDGLYDIGADEDYSSDVIFADDFEG